MNGLDAETMAELDIVLQAMTQLELERFCAGTLRAAARGQRLLRERFPAAWEAFNDRVEKGAL